ERGMGRWVGGGAAADRAGAVGAARHRGRAARQVVERVQDLHGARRTNRHARRGVARLHAERQVVRRRRGYLEGGRGGAGQAGGGGADGVAAGGVQQQGGGRGRAGGGGWGGGGS